MHEQKDYIGKTFHHLSVIAYAGKRDGMHRWLCRCSCGKETIVGQTLLQSGKTKSCGHLKGEKLKENLKLAEGTSITMIEASRRRRISTNRSGHTGVYWNKKAQKWVAQITFQSKTYYLGSFKDIEDAIKARKEGERMQDEFLEWYYKKNENLD